MRSERVRRLLDDLIRRGPNAYGIFLRCLRESGHEHLAEEVERNEQALIRERTPANSAISQASETGEYLYYRKADTQNGAFHSTMQPQDELCLSEQNSDPRTHAPSGLSVNAPSCLSTHEPTISASANSMGVGAGITQSTQPPEEQTSEGRLSPQQMEWQTNDLADSGAGPLGGGVGPLGGGDISSDVSSGNQGDQDRSSVSTGPSTSISKYRVSKDDKNFS